MPDVDWKEQLVDQIDFAWEHHFVSRMKGMTDDEFFWSPVEDTWTIHPATEGDSGSIDWEMGADPAPFTTIAWRMWHMSFFFIHRWQNHFGKQSFEPSRDVPIAASAAEGMEILTTAYEQWVDALGAMPEDRLSSPTGPTEGPFADYPFAALVLHINREFIHHASECCLIRDLYRQRESLG